MEIIPLFLILLALSLNDLLKNNFFNKKKYIILFFLILIFSPKFNLGNYKVYFQEYSVKDKQNSKLISIIDFVNQKIDNKNESIYIHQRSPELLVYLKKRSVSDFHINTFLYESYNKGKPVIKNINYVKKQLLEKKPKMIILLSSYKNEAPFVDKITYFDDLLKDYNFEKTINNYDIYLIKK